MKNLQKLLLIGLVTLASCSVVYGSTLRGPTKNLGNGRAKFDDDLREVVEFLKLQMQCGWEPAGIPPLAPYQTDYKGFNKQIGVWSFMGNFSDLTVAGLNEFDVQQLSWNNVLQRLSFDFLFESIKASGNYKTDIWTRFYGEAVHIFGDGLLDLELQNVHLHGSFKLRPSLSASGGLHVWGFKVTLEIGNVQSKTTGFMNSKLYTKAFNSWVEQWIDMLINDNQEEVSELIESLVVPPMNRLLTNANFLELLALILGFGSDYIPTEAFC